MLILKLRDKINILPKYVDLLTNCYENKNRQASVNITDFSDARPTTFIGQLVKQGNRDSGTEDKLSNKPQTEV